jgi:CRP-like cAMP-binding protein
MEELLKNQKRKKEFKKGQLIIEEGSASEGILLIESGTIKLFRTDLSGREMILKLAGKGDILGQSCLTHRKSHIYSATAVEPSVGYFTTSQELSLMDRGELYSFVLEKTDDQLVRNQELCIDLMRKSVRERLASHFSYMADHHGEPSPNGIKIKVRLSREEIASMVGTAHETAIRFIGEFKTSGLLREENRHFYITDSAELTKVANSFIRSLS